MATSKKLIVAIVLLGALIGFAALIFPLLGRPDHIHDYTETIQYSIKDDTAYYSQKCQHCDKYGPAKVLENSIVVTPENVQSVLDTNINGKTIVFGAYNFDNLLELRPSKSDSTTRIYAWTSDTTYDKTYAFALNELVKDDSFRYHYTRNIENVTFVGVEGASINNTFFVRSGETFADDQSAFNGGLIYDAVRGMDYMQADQRGKHASHISLTNITFQNLNFTGSNGLIYVDSTYQDSQVSTFVIKNCTFETSTAQQHKAAINLSCSQTGDIKDVVFESNTVSGHYQGIVIDNFENAIIDNNKFSNITDNAIGIYGDVDQDNYFTGLIFVKNNSLESGTGRAIEFNKGSDAEIVVSSNYIANFCNQNGEIMQFVDLGGETKYSLVDNFYKSMAIENLFDKTDDYVVIF